MKLPRLRSLLPYRKEGMGLTAKILMVTLPVAAFVAGKMVGSFFGDDKS